MNSLYQTPPQNIELEQSVLNQCLYHPEDIVFDILKSSDFYKTAHQIIFKVCLDLTNDSIPIDITSAMTKLQDLGKMDVVGGTAYLS